MLENKMITENPIERQIASVSVGIYDGTPVLDLDYPEDSTAETDMNVIMISMVILLRFRAPQKVHHLALMKCLR